MSSTYAGNNAFPSLITEPSDGEPANASAFNVPIEGLADRTVWLKTRVDERDGSHIRNIRKPAKTDTLAAAFDFAFTRADGTAQAFWAPSFQFWIKCGKNTAGKFYIGDNGDFILFDTAATSPPKVSFGCGGGRACVFDSTNRTTGGGVDPQYIRGPSGDYTGTWTTLSLDTIGSFLSYVRAGDAVVTPTNRMIVCGGGDLSGTGQFLIWKSDDDGATFTRVTVGNLVLSTDFLSRIICGKNGRLVAWNRRGSANQGDVLWYSDNNGDTWSSRSAIGFDNITDGVYLADLDLWAFATSASGTIYTTPDPVLGAFTSHAISSAPTAMGGYGHYLIITQSFASGWPQILLSLDGLATGLVFNTNYVGRDTVVAPHSHIAVAPLGHCLISSVSALTLTEKI